jgi:hypothetical protein
LDRPDPKSWLTSHPKWPIFHLVTTLSPDSPWNIRVVISRQFSILTRLRILFKNHASMIPDICNELSTSHFYHTRWKIDMRNGVKSGNCLDSTILFLNPDFVCTLLASTRQFRVTFSPDGQNDRFATLPEAPCRRHRAEGGSLCGVVVEFFCSVWWSFFVQCGGVLFSVVLFSVVEFCQS